MGFFPQPKGIRVMLIGGCESEQLPVFVLALIG